MSADDYLARFTTWATGNRSVRGVILLGSRAGGSSAADDLSDLDLLIIATRPKAFLTEKWLDDVGVSPLFSWAYRAPVGGQVVRQVVYEGPLVVDVGVTSVAQSLMAGVAVSSLRHASMRRRMPSTFVSQLDAWVDIVRRGTQVLVDKDRIAGRMVRSMPVRKHAEPSEEAFLNTVRTVFGLALWESKQLARHELWMALGTVDQQIKQSLLQLLQWHSGMDHEALDTMYSGRGVARWADARWLATLPATWSAYDEEAAWQSLDAVLDLSSSVAKEIGERMQFRYPAYEERCVRSWIAARRPSEPSR